MSFYQGRAMRSEPMRPRPTRGRRVVRVLQVMVLLGVLAALIQLPWGAWRHRVAVIDAIHVEGEQYLDPQRIARFAGIKPGDDLFDFDADRARQSLLGNPRVADARVTRSGLRGVNIRVVERRPVLLVRHGAPWELDSTGVLLSPFAEGAVADVPLLTGPDFEAYREGALLHTPSVRRGLEWVRVLSDRKSVV